jgi:hypothetical protein
LQQSLVVGELLVGQEILARGNECLLSKLVKSAFTYPVAILLPFCAPWPVPFLFSKFTILERIAFCCTPYISLCSGFFRMPSVCSYGSYPEEELPNWGGFVCIKALFYVRDGGEWF